MGVKYFKLENEGKEIIGINKKIVGQKIELKNSSRKQGKKNVGGAVQVHMDTGFKREMS